MPRTGTHREPILVLLFSLITCGLYYLYWMYVVSAETQDFLNEPDLSPGVELLLLVLTCGLYVFFWDWKIAKKIGRMQDRVGLPVTDNAILYLVLNLFGLGVVNAVIEQSHLNDVWSRATQNSAPYA